MAIKVEVLGIPKNHSDALNVVGSCTACGFTVHGYTREGVMASLKQFIDCPVCGATF